MEALMTLDDFPSDKRNCATCTRKGGDCERSKSNKQQHNGVLYSPLTGEPSGIVYCCPHYTGQTINTKDNGKSE